MNTGLCTLDGVTYEALAFSALPPQQIELLRHSLRCPGCHATAFFRARSVDGRSPCFGAHHLDECELATMGGGGWGDGGEGERPQVENVGNPIRIDLAVGGHDNPIVAGAADGERRRGRGRRFGIGDGAGHNAHPTRRLRPLLNALLDTDFSESRDLIEPPDRQPMPIRDFFVKAEDARVRGLGEFRGVWGQIRSVRQLGDSVWLNTGGRTSLSFVMSLDTLRQVLDRFGLVTKEALVGSDILVLSRCELSAAQPPKLYCAIPNPDYLTLRRPRVE